MSEMTILPVILIIAISIQCILAIKQGKALGDTFAEMRANGNVLVGKFKHYLKGGAYILFNVDELGVVYAAKVMKGRTIFSSIKVLPECIGKNIYDLNFDDKNTQRAYKDALEHYGNALNANDDKNSLDEYETV